MATEPQASTGSMDTTDDVPEERAGRVQRVDFDERLMPTCMMVMIVAGLGFLILVMAVWIAQNVGTVFT